MASLRWRMGVGVMAAGLTAVLVLVGVQAWHHVFPGNQPSGDPDPGGRILTVLKTAEAAVPADAHVTLRQEAEPHWDSCDGRDGTFGWSDVTVYLQFTSAQDTRTVVPVADAAMQRGGWHAMSTSSDPATAGGLWSRSGPGGRTATAQLGGQAYGSGSSWELYVGAPPDGQRASGC